MDNDDATERGRRLKERRVRHGLSERALALEITKQGGTMDRQTISRAEAGTASTGTYDRLESWFDRFEEEVGATEEEGGDHVEIEIRDFRGIGQAIYRGPVDDVPQFEAMLERLIERQKRAAD